MNMKEMMDITPDTRVGPLLESRPELETVLLEISPKYTALKNPVLRRTVAKLATLRQVARVGGVPLGELIRRLREAAGLESTVVDPIPTEAAHGDWMDGAEPVEELDIRPWLEAGEQPLDRVMKRLSELGRGEILALRAPFEPAPLMDLAEKKGFLSTVRTKEKHYMVIWFYRPA